MAFGRRYNLSFWGFLNGLFSGVKSLLVSGRVKFTPTFLSQKTSTWRIIPVSKWLETMVIVSPLRIGLWDPFQMAELYGWKTWGPIRSPRIRPGSPSSKYCNQQVECYGRGRIFLAGDACHCHSPLGGQGGGRPPGGNWEPWGSGTLGKLRES